jgi:CDP-diacylglycerol---serine O-phosphatidyltransferase
MRPRFRGERRRPQRYLLDNSANGFTLFNLFCGVHAIVLASRGNFSTATTWIVVGGIADALDGRVARATGTGSRLGEELDSLVDAISFGLAPAMIMFFAVLNRGNWEWLFAFFFVMCAVLRLARFNVEQAGRSKTHFHGLPSPAAGMTLATYYWFSQTPLYNQTVILLTDSTTPADLPWHTIMRWLMVALAALMISDVPYPAVPVIGVKSLRQIMGTLIVLGAALALIVRPREVLFPALLMYVLFGALKWVVLGLAGIRRKPEEIFFQPDPDEVSEGSMVPVPVRRATPAGTSPAVSNVRDDDLEGDVIHRRRKRRRRRGKDGRRPPNEQGAPRSERGSLDAPGTPSSSSSSSPPREDPNS